MVLRKILFRIRSVWWIGVLLILAFFFQKSIKASSHMFSATQGTFVTFAGEDSVQSQQQLPTGKLSRRALAAQRRTMLQETDLGIQKDTSLAAMLEAIRALPRDSSARVEQLKYVRTDKPVADGKHRKENALFLSEPPVVKYQANLDSTRWVYRLRRTVDDHDTRISTEIPFEEYYTLRLNRALRQNWESMAHASEFQGETKTTLGDLFKTVTKIEVPIPKNPIFSIFGKNIIRVNVNGRIDIHAGFRNVKSDLASTNPYEQDRNEPDFKQEIQVNVNGEIGDKLKIDADWNTQRTFEYENQLKVEYKGYEDEIVQNVQAGNVSLPTNSTLISGGQALFGIKAQFQLGPLRLTTVATQKKGEVKELSISGGGEATKVNIRPTEYSKNHYFIDTTYIDLYEDAYQPTPRVDPDMEIREIEVWVTATDRLIDIVNEADVVAFINQSDVINAQNSDSLRRKEYNKQPGTVETGRFIKLRTTDYNVNNNAGIISIRTALRANDAVAVSYLDGKNRRIGNTELEKRDSLKLVLKLVRPSQLNNEMKTAWKLMLKNRYSLTVSGIDRSSFEFNIAYQVSTSTPLTDVPESIIPGNVGFLEIFGLDRFMENNSDGHDKKFDYINGLTIDEVNGEVIFPTVEPFDSTNIVKFLNQHGGLDPVKIREAAGELSFRAIYDTVSTAAVNNDRNKYFLTGSVKGSGKSTFSLSGFNVVEGSVEVYSGGQRLTPNVDYTVDYISNQVVIRNQAYLVTGRDIQIKYESNDLFQLASKSLIGARGELDIGKNSSLGFTILNYTQQSLSDKVRLGEEPISNTIMGIDGRTSFNLPWITKGLNYLPGIKTTTASEFSINGEAAYMLPNPNTRTSPISSDGDKGVAFIDDFEGARQIIPLGVMYQQWKEASAPWYSPELDTVGLGGDGRDIRTSEDLIGNGILADTLKMNYKARACWFNIFPSDVNIPTIWGERKSYAQGEGQVTTLDFFFRPAERGAFNYSLDLENTIGLGNQNSHRQAWAGIQRVLGTTSTNLIEQNVAFIELWINIIKPSQGGKLNIDIGLISEDVIPNRQMNTEDGLGRGNIRSGSLDPNYDWGIDTMDNAKERLIPRIKDFLSRYPGIYDNDPSGDDFKTWPTAQPLTLERAAAYDGVNGTEGNHITQDGLFPDGEDLNANGNPDGVNAYFEYEVPLDPNDGSFTELVTGTGENNWYQIRIPLADYKRKIGEATFTSVEGVRVWVTGAEEPTLFRITEFNLVGNQWQKRDRTDESFEISVVNAEDNPYYDTRSIGVGRQRDRTRPDQEILGNEQSLNIIVRDLRDGQAKEVVRYYKERPLDMFDYRTLKMFVHGEKGNLEKNYEEFYFHSLTDYSAEVFIRFGDDTSNYYEYRAPVHPDWQGNDVTIKFGELTAIKAKVRDSLNMARELIVGGPPGAMYQVRGNPSLERVQFMSIGVENPANKGDTSITGELWANELRLTDVDDTPGWAYKFNTGIKLADVGNVSFSLSETDPFFHTLEKRFGSRSTSRAWNISTAFSFARLLPESWDGTSLNVTYQHSETMEIPRYIPGKDVLVETATAQVAADTSTSGVREYKDADDVRLQSESMSVTDSYAAQNVRLNIPAKTWLVTETINNMTFGYTYSNTRSRSPNIEYSWQWSWTADLRYSTQFDPNNYLTLGGLKIFYTPKQFGFGASFTRSQTKSKPRNQSQNPIQRNLNASRAMDFKWQFFEGGLLDFGIDYSVRISSELLHLEVDRNNRQRSFSEILSDIFLSDRLINFGKDRNYGQSIGFNTKLSSPEVLMLDKIFTPNLTYSVNYNWVDNMTGPLGRNAGWRSEPSFSLDVNLKPIADVIWPSTPASAPAPADTGAKKKSTDILKQLGMLSRVLIKYPFFDFDKFSITYSQSNSSSNSGVRGSTGFANLFGRVPFFQSSLDENGPSALYQLGFISDPNGYLVLKTKGTFPFITGYTVPGLRAYNPSNPSVLPNSYSQDNRISLRTSRPLWEGATVQLDWKVGWGYNETWNVSTDSLGRQSMASRNVSGSIDRSYISLPPVLMFKFFNTSIEKVSEKYESLKQDQGDTRTKAAKLSQAFEEGLEAFPWLTKLFGALAPRANWSVQWGGLDKYTPFNSFASKVSISHAYMSSYRMGWTLQATKDPVTNADRMEKVISSQTVKYEFSPLIGLDLTFKGMGKGNLNAKFQYRASTTYDLNPASYKTYETSSSGISISASYSRQGFEIPFFGVSLMNNIDISVNYSYTHSSKLYFDFEAFEKDGALQAGSGTTKIEPRIRYTLSERVTASLYYLHTKFTPDEGASITPGSTTNEGGFDIQILIQ